ncbi:MAG: polysaccharide deacetylase family protein [bacterium]|nr:polysaccharide deacetylase family protein [bacterium]
MKAVFRFLIAGLATALLAAGCGGGDPNNSASDDLSDAAVPFADPLVDDLTVSPAVTRGSTQSPELPGESVGTAEPTEVPIERTGVDWEDLESLAFEVDGRLIQLEDGRAEIANGSSSPDLYVLQNRVAQGDLNGDGCEDVVAHITESSAGTGTFHLLVLVMDDGQGGKAKQPVFVGDRIVMEEMTVKDGTVSVSFLDRELDEPFTVISLRKMLEIDVSELEPVVTVVESTPLEDLPLPDVDAPDIPITFDPGAVGSTVSGSINFQQRQPYTAHITAGQAFTAALQAPIGVWLDVRLGDEVLTSGAKRFQSVSTSLPATGAWKVTVVSTHAGQVDYRLYVEALPLGVRSASAPTPKQAQATEPILVPAVPNRANSADSGNIGDGPVMYFTFDDGPHPLYTPQVLDVLARYGVRATFFVIGSLAEQYPAIVQRIHAEGHTLANHTWNHENLAGLPQETFDHTISRTQDLLGAMATPCLRPPYGFIDAFTRDWAANHGLEVVLWNVDPADWRKPPAAEIARHIVQNARDGAVVLLHDGGGHRRQTVLGLETALSELSNHGYRYEPLCTR